MAELVALPIASSCTNWSEIRALNCLVFKWGAHGGTNVYAAALQENTYAGLYRDGGSTRFAFAVPATGLSSFGIGWVAYTVNGDAITSDTHGNNTLTVNTLGIPGAYSHRFDVSGASILDAPYGIFDSSSAIIAAFQAAFARLPITYRLTNCTAPGAPAKAASGQTVAVSIVPAAGYAIINPSSDVYVTNNGVIVQSSYANGTLTFTMP